MKQDDLVLAADRVRSKKKKRKTKTRNPVAPKTHHEIHSSPATATTSRRRATKPVPRVSSYSPASRDPGFVDIGLVQLSQSVKTMNVKHTHIHRQTTAIKQWHPVRIPGGKVASYLQQAMCVRKKKKSKKKNTKKKILSHPKHTTKSTAAW